MTNATKFFLKVKLVLNLWVFGFLRLISPAIFNSLRVFAQDFGTIKAPQGVDKYNQAAGGGNAIGIFIFISNMIKLATVAGGIWVLINFITAGWIYISSEGDASAGEKVGNKMTYSTIGLVIIALAYSIAGLLGLIIFGDASFILNPKIETIPN